MPTTSYHDPTSGFKAWTFQARTDDTGAAVTDADGEEARMPLDFFTEGIVTPSTAFQTVEDSPASMNVIVGSGTAETDLALVVGTASGQGNYLGRLQDATTTVSVPAADASNPRIDELYLVPLDDQFDSGGLTLFRIGYREGDPGSTPSAPGPDSAWDAFLHLATISVGASVTSITDSDITDERVRSALTLAGVTRLLVDSNGNTNIQTKAGGLIALTIDGAFQLLVSSSDIDARGNPISNVGTVDGVDVSAHAANVDAHHAQDHAARHAPGGGDAIDITDFEVDNSTEVASQALTSSFADIASVTLSIPAGWGSWKCEAWASFNSSGGTGDDIYDAVIRIDGTDQQTKAGVVVDSGDAIGGRRTGMTTTGSRTVALRARETLGQVTLTDVYLYARAVRTS